MPVHKPGTLWRFVEVFGITDVSQNETGSYPQAVIAVVGSFREREERVRRGGQAGLAANEKPRMGGRGFVRKQPALPARGGARGEGRAF